MTTECSTETFAQAQTPSQHLRKRGYKTKTLKPDDWLALREWMRAVRRAGAGQDTPYLRILRRFVPE